MRTVIVIVIALTSACAPYLVENPSEVEAVCELPHPTPDQPDPRSAWSPLYVQAFLLHHQNLWRATFPETDEWAPRAPLLPHLIEIVDEVTFEYEFEDTEEEYVGHTYPGGSVKVAGRGHQHAWLTPRCSSLGHELVHIALAAAYLDGDPNHTEPGGPWTEAHDEYILKLGDCEK